MSHTRTTPRPAKPASPHTGDRTSRDSLRRQLAAKILSWTEPHETCVVEGCRRNRRCLLPDGCRGVDYSDAPLSDADAAAVRANLRALKAYADGEGALP